MKLAHEFGSKDQALAKRKHNSMTATPKPHVRRGKATLGPSIWKREGPRAMPKVASFAEYVGQHSKTREDIKSWFDALDLHDYASFGGKP
jgi:hypothetical protein